jgi:CBS domain-containing protein
MADLSDVGSMPVAVLIGDTVMEVAPEATLYEVAEALTSGEVGVLAVARNGTVLGVVSERDLAHAVAARLDLGATTAMDVAHTTLVSCDARTTVAEVAAEMMEHWVRHVLVKEGGRLVGIVSGRDLLGAYASSDLPLD